MNTSTYKANRLADGLDNDQLKAIGDFSWRFGGSSDGRPVGLAIVMPNSKGNGAVDWIPVHYKDSSEIDKKRGWLFDGNLDQPTLTPSLLLEGEWHGYLCKGMLHSV